MADSEAARFLKKSPTRNRRNLFKNQATALFEQSTLSSVLILVPVILVLLLRLWSLLTTNYSNSCPECPSNSQQNDAIAREISGS